MVNDRWSQLDARVRRLEERLDAGETPADDRAGAYWVLDGLTARHQTDRVVYAGAVETADGPVRWQYGHRTEALRTLGETEVEQAAQRLAALGSPVRLRLMLAVLQGRTSTAALTELPDIGTTGQIYHHLRALTAAGWLRTVSRGVVQVPPERVVPAWVALAVVQ